jgi:hypothetical protein
MCSQASAESKKIVGVFYKANEYASLNPNFVGSLEGALGIRDWLESQGHQYIVTDDKEGLDSGECVCVCFAHCFVVCAHFTCLTLHKPK